MRMYPDRSAHRGLRNEPIKKKHGGQTP
jgi:hypothetical protein